jgi:hypothetical protein
MRRGSIAIEVVLTVLALLLLALPLTTQGTPLKHNFVSLTDVDAAVGIPFAMPVNLYNEAPLTQITAPIQIRLATFINIDSISFVGGRLDGIGQTSSIIDNAEHRMVINFGFPGKPATFLPPGNGMIAKIYMKVAPNTPPIDVLLDVTDAFLSYPYALIDTAGAQVADFFGWGIVKVIARGPVINLDPTVFNFSALVGNNPAPQTLHITNLGVDPLNWNITYKPTWLDVSLLNGTAPSDVVLQPQVSALPLGELHDSIAVTDTFAMPKTVWARVNVKITESNDVTRCIKLRQGWNLISWNVDTPDDGIETIIASIKGCVDVILGFEQGGATYDPFLPQYSTLNVLDHQHGYWFRMTCDTILCVTGVPVAPETPIALEENWNLVSYLPDVADSTPAAISSVLDKIVVALGYDNGGLTFDPTHPELATLKLMETGFGYWLKTTAPATLVYPTPFAAPPIFGQTPGSMRSYRPAPGVTATPEWVDLFGDGLTLDGTLIPAGSVLAAYDENGHLCGQAVIEASGKLSFTPIYRDDKSTSTVEGPDYGGKINLAINDTPVQQSYTFGSFGDRIRLSNLTSITKATQNVPRNFELAQNYPNPFNPGTSIEFSLPTTSRATVEVFNVVGERVTTLLDRFLPAGRYSVEWDGTDASGKQTASGLYLYRLTAGEFTETRKMMLVK